MSPKRLNCLAASLLAGALLLLPGCSSLGQEDGQTMLIYYATQDTNQTSAVQGWPEERGDLSYEALFQALKTPPEDLFLYSQIPQGTTLEGVELEDGVLHLEVSGEYSTLSGVEQTIANSCVTLTYCQLPEVDGVCITSGGESMSGDQMMKPAHIMTDGGEGDTGQLEIKLYFPLTDGGTGYQTRQLTITENRTAPETVLQALCDGPTNRALTAFLPVSMSGITLWVEDTICYVNLTAEWVENLEDASVGLTQALQCVTNSICELDTVQSVQFLMDGAVLDQWARVGGNFPIEPNTEGCTQIDS